MTFIFGVDLDGVVANYTDMLRSYVQPDRDYALPDPTSWHFPEWFTKPGEFSHYHEKMLYDRGFSRMETLPGAVESLTRLSDEGIHIRIITHRLIISHRHALAAADTVQWLDEQKIPYSDLCFIASKQDVSADMYIEDAPKNIEALQESVGKHRVLIYDQLYNREVKGRRVTSWNQAEENVLAVAKDRMFCG